MKKCDISWCKNIIEDGERYCFKCEEDLNESDQKKEDYFEDDDGI